MVSKATHTATYEIQTLIGFINYDRLLALCYLRLKCTNGMFRKKNYTKWIPLGSFTHIADYVVMVRKNKNNGMLQFKVKRMHGRLLFGNCEPFFRAKIDTQAAWDEIVSK